MTKITITHKPSVHKVTVGYMSPTKYKGIKVRTGAKEYILRKKIYAEACNE